MSVQLMFAQMCGWLLDPNAHAPALLIEDLVRPTRTRDGLGHRARKRSGTGHKYKALVNRTHTHTHTCTITDTSQEERYWSSSSTLSDCDWSGHSEEID